MTDYYWRPLDDSTHMLILLLPLILINYIRNLKLLAPFSTLANLITLIGLGMVLSYMFDDLPSMSERNMFGTLRNFSLYFGTTLFALEAVGVVSIWRKIFFLDSVVNLIFHRGIFLYTYKRLKLTYEYAKASVNVIHVQLFIIAVCPEIFLKLNFFCVL